MLLAGLCCPALSKVAGDRPGGRDTSWHGQELILVGFCLQYNTIEVVLEGKWV